jgi:hypothetical protein
MKSISFLCDEPVYSSEPNSLVTLLVCLNEKIKKKARNVYLSTKTSFLVQYHI